MEGFQEVPTTFSVVTAEPPLQWPLSFPIDGFQKVPTAFSVAAAEPPLQWPLSFPIDEFIEETCDSDSVVGESQSLHAFPGYGSSRSSSTRSSDLFFLPDDCLSSTSDSDDVEGDSAPATSPCSYAAMEEEGELSSALNYLKKASDDELGIPPPASREEILFQTLDLDYSALENSEEATVQKDEQSLFWLKFLRSQ